MHFKCKQIIQFASNRKFSNDLIYLLGSYITDSLASKTAHAMKGICPLVPACLCDELGWSSEPIDGKEWKAMKTDVKYKNK